MELIKGLTQNIKKSLPAGATSVTAVVYDSRGNNVGTGAVELDNSLATVTVPYSVVNAEGNYVLRVSFVMDSNPYSTETPFNVATPYLDLWELQEILEYTDHDDAWRVEAAARHIINAHCGQSFGLREDTIKVRGDGSPALTLPERTESIDLVTRNGHVVYNVLETNGDYFLGEGRYRLSNHGFYLNRLSASEGGYYEYTSSDPIVVSPQTANVYRKKETQWEITGTFGHKFVPEEVREAMRLLVNDYACGEQMYRDRFIQAISASDWRLQYNDGAYSDTGNARANLLLSNHVINRMMVI